MEKEMRPWKPYISLEQIYAFEPGKPETSTGSPFVDTLLTMFADPEISLGANFSKYLGVDYHAITGYLVVATGYKFVDLRRLWTQHKVEEFRKKWPGISQTDMAALLGYKDPSSMWRFLNAKEQTRKQKADRHEIHNHSKYPWRHDDEKPPFGPTKR